MKESKLSFLWSVYSLLESKVQFCTWKLNNLSHPFKWCSCPTYCGFWSASFTYQLPNMLPCLLKTILASSSNLTAQRLGLVGFFLSCRIVEKVCISKSLLSVLASHSGNKERNRVSGEWLRSLRWGGGLLPSVSLSPTAQRRKGEQQLCHKRESIRWKWSC